MGNSYVGRQPIVDERGALVAYDLFSSSQNVNTYATATLVNNIQSVFGIEKILGKRVGFVRIDHTFVFHRLLELLPKEKVVYALLEESVVNDELCEYLRIHREKGYRFALNDCSFSPETLAKFSPVLEYLECVKIDVPRSGRIKRDDIEELKKRGLKVIGAKIESHDMHSECIGKGFTLFQGYFISKPKILENPSFSVDQASVLGLWNMLQSDADIDQLVSAFELNHMVSVKLIRFINSAIFSLGNPVSSVRHVLTLLGRESLSHWVMLLLFSEAQDTDESSAPLMLMVVSRTELMVQLLELVKPNALREERSTAYFVGMLSLIHLLFHISHRDALKRLNVAVELERALFEGDGFYGELLTTVRAIEMVDMEGIETFLTKYSLPHEALEPLIASAMEKVNQFDEAMG
jgi:c-di-GMP phosphodiesterase